MKTKISVGWIGVVSVCGLVLLGCTVVRTSVVPKDEDVIEGIVYHLPASLLKVSIESKKDAKGNHSELVVGVGPELIPDKSARLVLKSSGNEFFTRDHAFAFTNGMLSSVAIDDEGKGGEIITDIAAIAMNVLSFGALPVGGGLVPAAATGHDNPWPSNPEILAALSTVVPGQNNYLFPLAAQTDRRALPGTAQLLSFSAKIEGMTNSKPDLAKANLSGYPGIAVRILEPYPVRVTMELNLPKLYSNRIDKYTQAIKDLSKSISDTKQEIEKQENALKVDPKDKDAQAKLESAQKTLDELAKSEVDAKVRKADNEGFANSRPLRDYYEIVSQATVIQVPDYSPVVKIPISRGPVGRTKYNLTLNHGIITSYHAEQPSAGLEIIKIPLNISGKIVELPAKILQLKFEYSSKVEALATQQGKQLDALKALAGKQNGPTEHDDQLKALQNEKAILQLQKDIAELQAAISKLENP